MNNRNFLKKVEIIDLVTVLFAFVLYIFLQNIVYIICSKFNTAYTITACISCIVCAFFMYFVFERGITKKLQILSLRENVSLTDFKLNMLLWVVIVGMTGCYILNAFVSLTNVTQTITSYNEVSKLLYSGEMVLVELQMVILAPLAEEIFFRGVIYQGLIPSFGKFFAAIVSLLLFAFMHGNILQGIYAFVMGLMLIFVFERFQSLWACIILHMSANLISFVGTKTDLIDVLFSSGIIINTYIIICAVLLVISIIKIYTNMCYIRNVENNL